LDGIRLRDRLSTSEAGRIRITGAKRAHRARSKGSVGAKGTESGWCAWQESNLLPFGPEPNALSGELQARDRFTSLEAAAS
jgi:hypothetical protein